MAKEKKVALVVSLFERRAAGVYHNTCAILDADGSYLGKYRKMHIPDDPLYYEKFYFTPGDLGFLNFDTKYARIGVQICWDQWYPEGSRITAMRGAQVIFYPTSIGWHPHEKAEFGAAQLDAWKTIQRAHAVANGIYVAVVNRVGFEGKPEKGDAGLEFWGNSFVADPFGVGDGGGIAGEGRNIGGGVRSGEERGDAEELAVFQGSEGGCVWGDCWRGGWEKREVRSKGEELRVQRTGRGIRTQRREKGSGSG